MANYTKTQLLDAYCEAKNYQDQVLDVDGETLIDNPETKVQFLDRTEREHSKSIATRHLIRKARAVSDQAERAKFGTEL